MPTLDISSSSLGRPQFSDIGYLQAIMLWPDDARARAHFLARWRVADLEGRAALSGLPVDTEVSVPLSLLVTLAEAPAAQVLAEAAENIGNRAVAAGHALLSYYSVEILRARFPSAEAEKWASWALLDLNPNLAQAKADNNWSWFSNKAWAPYKTVSHLWAARIIEGVLAESRQVPCGLKAYRRFLALADSLCEWGTGHIPPSQANPLLPPDAVWRVPAILSDGDYESADEAFVRAAAKLGVT